MKKFTLILAVLLSMAVITLSMTACGKSDAEVQSEAEESFASVMEAFKNGDIETIKSYCMSPDTISDDTELRSAILSSLENVTYDIKSKSVNDNKNITVNAEITMIDSSKVMEKYIENIAALISSSDYQNKLDTITREEYQELMNNELKKALNNQDIPSVTKEVSVNMRYDNGVWKLNGSELTDLLITNTIDAISQIRQ